jgi:photosystem II stability/assembly factor-like uncharacterized protein
VVSVRKLSSGLLASLFVAALLTLSPHPAEASTWRTIQGEAIDYHAVDFVDASRGWVGGITFIPPGYYGFEDRAIISRTGSGGASWQSAYQGNNFLTVTDLDFVDGARGWAVLSDGTIVSTGDGGVTWALQAGGSFDYRDNNWGYESVAMGDAEHGCAVGSWVGFIGVVYPRIVYTEDGSEWKSAALPKPAGGRLESVCMVDAEYGWAVGSVGPGDNAPLVLATHDGGASWDRQTTGLPSDGASFHGVWFVDRQHGWAVGDSGAIYVTSDGGTSWTGQPSGVSKTLLDVCFAGSSTGWVVGEGGTILETTQAGSSWVMQTTPTTTTLRAVASAGGSVGAVGNEGVILAAAVPAPPGGFSDVGPATLYSGAITDLSNRGIVSGYRDGTFRPHQNVKRMQFAKMIVRTLALPVSESDICPFTDVRGDLDPDDPLYPDNYVAVCAAHRITEGVTAESFAPFDFISQQQLITMVARAADLADPPPGYTPPFSAAQFTLLDHYLNARAAAFHGLLSGLVGLDLGHDFSVPSTRGEACLLLDNLLNLVGPD